MSGYVNRGELVAVMGPSSAGKSTLFNALTFQNLSGLQVRVSKSLLTARCNRTSFSTPPLLQASGDRLANGVRMSPMNMTSIAGYIPQFDVFIGTLTVREHLTFLVWICKKCAVLRVVISLNLVLYYSIM